MKLFYFNLFEDLHALESITGTAYDRIHLFGGGSQNALLCELTANACKCEVVAGPVEATALGNLLIQARTMGDLPAGMSVRDASAAYLLGLRTHHWARYPVAIRGNCLGSRLITHGFAHRSGVPSPCSPTRDWVCAHGRAVG